MSKLRKYRTMKINLNAIDLEKLIKDDDEMKSAVETLQKTLQNTTEYTPSCCRRIAFAWIVGIIPDRYVYNVLTDVSTSYRCVCSSIINTMTCDGMTEKEYRMALSNRNLCGEYTTTIQTLW